MEIKGINMELTGSEERKVIQWAEHNHIIEYEVRQFKQLTYVIGIDNYKQIIIKYLEDIN